MLQKCVDIKYSKAKKNVFYANHFILLHSQHTSLIRNISSNQDDMQLAHSRLPSYRDKHAQV